MKIVPKAQYGRPLVAQSDNTRVFTPWVRERKYKPKKKRIVQPIITAPNTPRQLQEEYNKQGRTVWKNIKKQQDQEKAAKIADGFLTFISPSTWVGPAFNLDETYSQALQNGSGSGNALLNTVIDFAPPVPLFTPKKVTLGTNIPLQAATRNYVKPQVLFSASRSSKLNKYTPEELAEHRKRFRTWMPSQGLDLKRSEKYPEIDEELFLNPGQISPIIPSEGSDLKNYLDWLGNNFKLTFKQEANIHPANAFPKGVMGDHHYGTGESRINPAYPTNAKSTFIHEVGSHGTDLEVQDMRVANYPFKLRYPSIRQLLVSDRLTPESTVSNIYSNIAGIRPDITTTIKDRIKRRDFRLTRGTNTSKYSSNWKEARATLNETRAKLFHEGKFSNAQEWLERDIDEASDLDILNILKDLNAYGRDYVYAYKRLSPQKQKEWMQRVRHALKYLPATTPFIFPAIQNKNEE